MAELNMKLRGGKYVGIEAINYWVARHKNVRIAVAGIGGPMAAKAKAIHAMHKDTGASYVGGEMGSTDYIIYLDDERGLDQAFAIEFGHYDKRLGRWVDGIHAIKQF